MSLTEAQIAQIKNLINDQMYFNAENGAATNFTLQEKVSYALKLSLQRVTTDAFATGKEWYTEPDIFNPVFKNQIYSKPIPRYGEVSAYYCVVNFKGKKYITNITVNTIFTNLANSNLIDILGNTTQVLPPENADKSTSYEDSRTPISTDFNADGLLTKLPRSSWAFFNYWKKYLTGTKAKNNIGDSIPTNTADTGTYPNVNEKSTVLTVIGNTVNAAKNYSNLNNNAGLLDAFLDYIPLEIIPNIVVDTFISENGSLDQINTDYTELLKNTNDSININMGISTYSTWSGVHINNITNVNNSQYSDNMGFYNPLLPFSLGERYGYNSRDAGDGYYMISSNTDKTNITASFGQGGDVKEGTMIFSADTGFILFFGIGNVITGVFNGLTSPISVSQPPIISCFKYVGGTFDDGIINNGAINPLPINSSVGDIFINTTDDILYLLKENSGTKEWVALGGSTSIEQGTVLPDTSGLEGGELFIDTDDNKLYRFDGTEWVVLSGGGNIPPSILKLEEYLTQPPPKFNRILLEEEYSDQERTSIAENQLDAIGRHVTINRGMNYEGNSLLEWSLQNIQLPYVNAIQVDIRDITHDTDFLPFQVLSASAETFTIHLGDIVGDNTQESDEKFVLNILNKYRIRVTPLNNAHTEHITNPSFLDISLVNSTQQTALNQYTDLSLNWTTPYNRLRPGTNETIKQWTRDISVESVQYRTIQRAKKNLRINEFGIDLSNVFYVNLGDTQSVGHFIRAWRETLSISSTENIWNERNKLYTNVGAFGRSLDEYPDNSGVFVRPFAGIWYDDRLSWAVDHVHGKMNQDISSDYVKFNDVSSGDTREQLVQNGVWAGYPYEKRDDEFETDKIGYPEAGHWSRNMLAGLDTGIEFNTFNSSDSDRVDASFQILEDISLGNVVEFLDVSNVDSWALQDLSRTDLRHNTSVGRYSLQLNHVVLDGRKKTIFYKDQETGEGLTVIERNGVKRGVGITEASTLPYYIGTIVEGLGVDGNLSNLSEHEYYLFAQRVFVDDLVGKPSLHTFIVEYNIWRNMLYDTTNQPRGNPLVAFCLGVPSLVSVESRLFSEVANVCGTVLPYGGRIAKYSMLSAFTPRKIEFNEPKEQIQRYLDGSHIWEIDISTNFVNTTFDLIDLCGQPIQWSLSNNHEVVFSDTIMNTCIPMVKVDMYSLSYPDGVTDYGELCIREEDLGIEGGERIEHGFMWIHSDARSFVGRLSKSVEDEITVLYNDFEYSYFGGIGGIHYDVSLIEPVGLVQDIWKTTVDDSEARSTWVIDHKIVHTQETISGDELLFYGGAFVNGNATIQNGVFTRLNGEKTRYVHEQYNNPYDLVSHVYDQYIGKDTDESPSAFENVFGEETEYLSQLRSDLSGVSRIHEYKQTGTRDILVNGESIEYKWVTKQFKTTTNPLNERKMFRLNYEFEPSIWKQNGFRVYTKQRAYYENNGELSFYETSWFSTDSSNSIENYWDLFNRTMYPDGSGNVVEHQFVYGTNGNILPRNTVIDGQLVAEHLRYGYSEIFVRVGIPVTNTDIYKTMLWDLKLFDASEIESVSMSTMNLLKTSVWNNVYHTFDTDTNGTSGSSVSIPDFYSRLQLFNANM